MNERRDVLAVVMARGGSVGLPGKALRMLRGRRVLEYTLDHVRESRLITRAVVSSDDAEILAVARAAGFETIARPAELATSTSATDPVLRHAVRTLYPAWSGWDETTVNTKSTELNPGKKKTVSVSSVHSVVSNESPQAAVMLYGNVPVRKGQMIDRCIEMLFETGADSVQTIAPVGKFHPYWMFDRAGDGRIAKHIPNNVFRRQDLPPLFSPTGAVYVMKTAVLMAAEGGGDPHAFLGADRRGLVVAPEDSVDIDTEKDLYVAEAVLRMEGERRAT
jgi:N-acylneuraminate cytidylyltransferase